MKTFRHPRWTGKRDYECTNVCACQAETAPDAEWIEDSGAIAPNMTQLWIERGVRYWGYL